MNKNQDIFIDESKSSTETTINDIRFYFFSILKYKYIILITTIVGFLVAFFFARSLPNIYQSKVQINVEKKQQSILTGLSVSEGSAGSDIQSQIAIMKGYYVREIVAKSILDTLKLIKDIDKSLYPNLFIKNKDNTYNLIGEDGLRKRLEGMASIAAPKNLNIIDISVKSTSFPEASLISIIYANSYLSYSLELSKSELTLKRKFLETEKEKKFNELSVAESNLENFQKQNGIVDVQQNVSELLGKSSEVENIKNLGKIDLNAVEIQINNLKNKISEISPEVDLYVNSQANQSKFTALSSEIASLEVKRDIDLSTIDNPQVYSKVEIDYNKKINSLKSQYDKYYEEFIIGITSLTPDIKNDLTTELFKANIQKQTIQNKIGIVNSLSSQYNAQIKTLPSQVIEYAKLERDKLAAEKLYAALESNYQEALINERTQTIKSYVIDPGYDDNSPIGPDRRNMNIFGIIAGLILGLVFALVRVYFNKNISTPEELEAKGVSLLSWIPNIDLLTDKSDPTNDFIVAKKPTSQISEAFKALRTRITFAKLEDKPLKSILVTSSLPSDGKTIVSVNLAGSFALDNKKVLLIDCDLRKPRVHSVFDFERFPGLSDFLFHHVNFEDIVRDSGFTNLSVITAGTIPPNPSEMLGSLQMKKFLELVESKYDIVILDSPPLISVTDSEILYNLTDGTVLVAQAEKTDKKAFFKTYNQLKRINPHNLLGAVLNNFKFNTSYGYYYNYYYYYSGDSKKKNN
ncbi:MAG: polysaccharide biosynthesis tyrosine autokinase [Ignavibacteria bacterium]|nr:polysaccharide biosynthesis tyrosine autokinase [Ignavibacteria bacterium]